ncbi:hypothetical protein L3V83_02265 [Thiotrichales bacterium 19X7-9]|nr:hypothetical protein [Thiotrichales bacterium 19X7-9]
MFIADEPILEPKPLFIPFFSKSEKIYLHMTDTKNIESIMEKGLIPGYKLGIGRANDRGDIDKKEACPEGIFVVNPGKFILDTAPGNIFIITLEEPSLDVNYKRDKHDEYPAGFFPVTEPIKPLHHAKKDDKKKIYCFILTDGDLDEVTKEALSKLGIKDTKWITDKVKISFPLRSYASHNKSPSLQDDIPSSTYIFEPYSSDDDSDNDVLANDDDLIFQMD